MYYDKISDIANNFFFQLTFEQIEQIFGVDLIGLSEDETEVKLQEAQELWNSLDWNSVMQIINDNE
jgi:hypothetical protein